MIIRDGWNTHHGARVDTRGRLYVKSLSQTEFHAVSEDTQSSYMVTTDFVSLTTTASYTGIFYMSYTGNDEGDVYAIGICGTQAAKWRFILGPTTGTLISAGTAITPVNLNRGTANTYNGTVLKGTDAQTITDGDEFAVCRTTVNNRFEFEGAMILTPNQAVAVEVQPDAAGDFGVTAWFAEDIK